MAPAWRWAPVTNACAAARGRDDFVLERRSEGLELRGAQRSRARAGRTRRSGLRRASVHARAPSCRRVVRALRRAMDGWIARGFARQALRWSRELSRGWCGVARSLRRRRLLRRVMRRCHARVRNQTRGGA